MVLEIFRTSKFRRDLRKIFRQNKDIQELYTVIGMLVEKTALPQKYKDHALTGNWVGYRECHIRPDWLLIYQIDGGILYLARTGTHYCFQNS